MKKCHLTKKGISFITTLNGSTSDRSIHKTKRKGKNEKKMITTIVKYTIILVMYHQFDSAAASLLTYSILDSTVNKIRIQDQQQGFLQSICHLSQSCGS